MKNSTLSLSKSGLCVLEIGHMMDIGLTSHKDIIMTKHKCLCDG